MPRPKNTNKTPPHNPNKKSEVLSFTMSSTEKATLLERKKQSQTLSDFLRTELVSEAKLVKQFSGVSYIVDKLQDRMTKVEEVMTKVEKATVHHNHLMAQVVEIFKRVESNIATITATQASDHQDLKAVVDGVNNLVGTLAEERVAVAAQINQMTGTIQELLGLLSGRTEGQLPDQNRAAGPGGP
jgi:hypothetical protein